MIYIILGNQVILSGSLSYLLFILIELTIVITAISNAYLKNMDTLELQI
jgi:hypothetical protein